MKNKIQMLLGKKKKKNDIQRGARLEILIQLFFQVMRLLLRTHKNCYFGLHTLQIMLRKWDKYGGEKKKRRKM